MVLLLDGNAVSQSVKQDLRQRVERLQHHGVFPGLGTLLVGNDPASARYVAGKHRDCAEVGIKSIKYDLPESATTEDIIRTVDDLNADAQCTGFIVQLPLPKGTDTHAVIDEIDACKDADGMHPYNLGQLVLHVSGEISTPLPCTPRGILELLAAYNIDLDGKNVCVVGRGITIGRTIGLLLTRKECNATVTLCHTGTRDLHEQMKRADVIIAATGQPGIVQANDVKDGAVLVDVGIARIQDKTTGKWRISGDIDTSARNVASAYTPNPGGVGPMTRAMLLTNVVETAERQAFGK
ncbi:bifunctional methylenetetrahydrofolate dehydrogenase/methenyltetrahydrofolate cyclohydrolase [Bifidobacterium aquikefiri]|uniref:bifunctional methylenetetrahydrofolate dehydrogenase/methenyltetrahydrofolate cyclohydrolase n=1 Tax=Bifidobacterium aquikefiri TaxID=1653207 RepID=UPI0023F457E1|nr:bifunctional methylenetetrahydrofolate dehydrogenase/methenyltetrahydrofolate cyclohydrolase [Bifidobacterium aquikefiri]